MVWSCRTGPDSAPAATPDSDVRLLKRRSPSLLDAVRQGYLNGADPLLVYLALPTPAPTPQPPPPHPPPSSSRWAPIASSPTGTSCSYYQTLAKGSNKMKLVELGKSSEGRPYIALFISSPANLAKLDHYRQINARLADPRGLARPRRKKLVAEGRVVDPVLRAALERGRGVADGRGVRLRQPHPHRRRSDARCSTT